MTDNVSSVVSNPSISEEVPEDLVALRARVANYERIMKDYYGRWYDQGLRHLSSLRESLAQREAQYNATSKPPILTVESFPEGAQLQSKKPSGP